MPNIEHPQQADECAKRVVEIRGAEESGKRLAALAALGRQFSMQFAGGQAFLQRQAEMAQGSIGFKVMQDCGVNAKVFEALGLRNAKMFETLAAAGKTFSAAQQVTQGIVAGNETFRRFGLALRDLKLAQRMAIARHRRAASLLAALPDEATFGLIRPMLHVLAIGDGRKVARLVAGLERRAGSDPEAAALLEWLYAILDLLAVNAFAQQLAAIAAAVDRSIAHYLGRLEWRLREPDRSTDPVAHRHCANAPNAASAMEAVAA